jgi:hypothetical protein
VRVEVTQADIDAGRQCDIQRCPVARAIGRTGWAAAVAGAHAMLWRPDATAQPIHDVWLGDRVAHFIYMFDAFGRPGVTPFEFELAIEDKIRSAA